MSWLMKGLATSVGLASILLLVSRCGSRGPTHSMHESSRSGFTGTWQELAVALGGLVVAFVLLQLGRRWEA